MTSTPSDRPCVWSATTTSSRPVLRLGGASPGGLALPPASPAAGHRDAPRGVWTDGTRIAVTDTGNHRVLIWPEWPTEDGAPADVVLGQPGFDREGPAAGGTSTRAGLNLPTGIGVVDGNLVVADAWHHRLLAWDGIPETSFAEPAAVLGQGSFDEVEPNRGGEPSLTSFYWPFGFAVVAGVFWVADTGNRRVLGWRGAGLPEPGRPADILLGQDDAASREDNRGGISGASFRWPHMVAGDEQTLFVADAGDHRVLGWSPPPHDASAEATVVLGQDSLTAMEEFKLRPQTVTLCPQSVTFRRQHIALSHDHLQHPAQLGRVTLHAHWRRCKL